MCTKSGAGLALEAMRLVPQSVGLARLAPRFGFIMRMRAKFGAAAACAQDAFAGLLIVTLIRAPGQTHATGHWVHGQARMPLGVLQEPSKAKIVSGLKPPPGYNNCHHDLI